MGLFKKSKEVVPEGMPAPPPFDPAREGINSMKAPPPPVPPGQPTTQEQESEPPMPPAPAVAQSAPQQDPLHIPDIRPNVERMFPTPEPEEAEAVPQEPLDTNLDLKVVSKGEHPQPIFVSATDYQSIVEGIERIKRGLGETEAHIAKILDMKMKQEKIVDEWKSHLEDIQKKLNYVDEVIFKVE